LALGDLTLLLVGSDSLAQQLHVHLEHRGADIERAEARQALDTIRVAVPDLIIISLDASGADAGRIRDALISDGRPPRLLVLCEKKNAAQTGVYKHDFIATLEPELGAELIASSIDSLCTMLGNAKAALRPLRSLIADVRRAQMPARPAPAPAKVLAPPPAAGHAAKAVVEPKPEIKAQPKIETTLEIKPQPKVEPKVEPAIVPNVEEETDLAIEISIAPPSLPPPNAEPVALAPVMSTPPIMRAPVMSTPPIMRAPIVSTPPPLKRALVVSAPPVVRAPVVLAPVEPTPVAPASVPTVTPVPSIASELSMSAEVPKLHMRARALLLRMTRAQQASAAAAVLICLIGAATANSGDDRPALAAQASANLSAVARQAAQPVPPSFASTPPALPSPPQAAQAAAAQPATPSLAAAVQDEADEADESLNDGEVYDPKGDPARARANFHVNAGHRLRKQGRLGMAEASYLKALQAMPNYARAVSGLVAVHLARRDGVEALRWARKLVQLQPKRGIHQRLLGDAHALTGSTAAARQAWQLGMRLGDRTSRQRMQ